MPSRNLILNKLPPQHEFPVYLFVLGALARLEQLVWVLSLLLGTGEGWALTWETGLMGCGAPEANGRVVAITSQRPTGRKQWPSHPFPMGKPLSRGSHGGPVFHFLWRKVAFPYPLYESLYPQLVKIQGNSTRRCIEKGFASRATATLNQTANYFLCKLLQLLGHIPP